MKKKLLFVIDSLAIGGAEKSLISLLNLIDQSIYEVDLLLFKKGGELETFIPDYVKVLPLPNYHKFMSGNKFPIHKKALYLYYRYKASVNLRLNKIIQVPLHSEQVIYNCIKKILVFPTKNNYDAAIAYSQGMPTYFVADKVDATKKFAWINTDYKNTQYNKDIDYNSYRKMDKIVAVSQNTLNSVSKIREEYKNKVDLILDIIDPVLINKMAEEKFENNFEQNKVNIVTVGRLEKVKGYDRAIKVASLLRNEGYNFNWIVIGEGPERTNLQELINSYDLSKHFYLVGKKINPYPYMKNCDIYVQTSTKEGFGLTVCEAKILKKPVICTDFPTAKEIITNGIDGFIVQHEIHSIKKAIIDLINNGKLYKQIKTNLELSTTYNTVKEINKFYSLLSE
jgi:glycosyltransferase involved in cell wall biosynthesis